MNAKQSAKNTVAAGANSYAKNQGALIQTSQN